MGRPRYIANSVLLSICRMQCVTTNPYHSLDLILVWAQKATNAQKLPRWTPDTSSPVLQPCVLETVDQNDQKLNLTEELSLGITGVIQSTHPNSSVTWRPVGVNTSPSTTKKKSMYFNGISTAAGTIQYQFAQRRLKLLRASLEARRIILFIAYNVCGYCSTFFSFGVVLNMKGKNNCV